MDEALPSDISLDELLKWGNSPERTLLMDRRYRRALRRRQRPITEFFHSPLQIETIGITLDFKQIYAEIGVPANTPPGSPEDRIILEERASAAD